MNVIPHNMVDLLGFREVEYTLEAVRDSKCSQITYLARALNPKRRCAYCLTLGEPYKHPFQQCPKLREDRYLREVLIHSLQVRSPATYIRYDNEDDEIEEICSEYVAQS
ncbi:hypothetical protein FRB99_006334 [Tulasnella sp. 403]|nr:hypothetical protein FRB99_006334 [Tulasnella sp. 403]